MNQLLEEPKIPNSDNFSGMQVRTISGLDAQQIADAKCSIMQDFIQVQANITQPQKDKEGMHGAKYATLNNVLSSIKEASKGIDLAFIQQPLMQGGKSGVINYLINSKGAIMDFGAYLLDVGGSKPQDAGGAITYARRYSISAIFGIASEEDTDAQEYNNRPWFYPPAEIRAIEVVYNSKRTPLPYVYAKALAGDELAQQVIRDKTNSAKVKIGIKSLSEIYEFNQEVLKSKDKEKKQIEKENEAIKKIVDGTSQKDNDPFNKIK